jgi:hypothetical protein
MAMTAEEYAAMKKEMITDQVAGYDDLTEDADDEDEGEYDDEEYEDATEYIDEDENTDEA